MLIPKISSKEVAQTIELLKSLKILNQANNGKLVISDPFITADTTIPVASIHK
ncbi:MAG TPA: hypothetical protein DCO75_03150 [Fibrobacteres bacterium]|nr:hypothetical protein [Fibrobacterota bacterium]